MATQARQCPDRRRRLRLAGGPRRQQHARRRGGIDYADYYEMGGPVSIDLTVGRAVHSTGTDTLISIEQFRGTYFADTFIGDGVDNYFIGMGGNDTRAAVAGPTAGRL